MSSAIHPVGSRSTQSSAVSTYGGTFSLDHDVLSILTSSKDQSKADNGVERIVKDTVIQVQGIDVTFQLIIDCMPHAIHHEVHMSWTGRDSSSKTPDREVLLEIDIRHNVPGKTDHTMIWARLGSKNTKRVTFSDTHWTPFLLPLDTRKLTAKEEIEQANGVVTCYWIERLWRIDSAWRDEALLPHLECVVERLLLSTLTDVYVANQ